MLHRAAVMLMALSIGLGGLQRCRTLRDSVWLVAAYGRSLDRLESALRFQHLPLPQAFSLAAMESGAAADYWQAQREFVLEHCAGEQPVAPPGLQGLELPLQAMCSAVDLEEQLRLLEGLRLEVERSRKEQSVAVGQQCKTAMSLSLCLAAVCAIVLM